MEKVLEKAIKVGNLWYIPTTSSRADDRVRVLKSDDGFAVLSRHGEMGWAGLAEQGFYFLGTRHLSRWQLAAEGYELVLLNSTVRLDNSRLVVDQTTQDIYRDDAIWIPKGKIHFRRELAMHHRTLSERLEVYNFHDEHRVLSIQYSFGADFIDIFEVRGVQRQKRGRVKAPEMQERAVVLLYEGLDGITRRTRIGFSVEPAELSQEGAGFTLSLAPGEKFELEVSIASDSGGESFFLPNHHQTVAAIDREMAAGEASRARIWTDNEQFNDWINQSAHDLQLLTTETRYGLYPYAGIPWFATPFGRDGLITALQTLWIQPELAKGVLTFLAATQADHADEANEAEAGKILHELREGEMATLGEIPFRRYYGTVDATPLFVLLAHRHYQRSGDREFIESIWSNLEAATEWIVRHAAATGFLTYQRHGERGLVHQGWKDSDDSVFHRDGSPATAPIALCEVQGYAYEALLGAAALARVLGHTDQAATWSARAAQLFEDIDRCFWLDHLKIYAIAVDGNGEPCCVRSSNAAHLMYSGAVRSERVNPLAESLMSDAACNGWGLRTVFAGEPRYNPMSYHNGSVWPHDTAIAAAGLARYGHRDAASKLVEGLFNAAIMFDSHRLPELFCGFERLPGQAPTLYPSACSPQAWASGAVFMLIESLLGLEIKAADKRVVFRHPCLPYYLNWMRIGNLRCGDAYMDVVLRRHGGDVAVNIESRRGPVELMIEL